LTATAVLDCLLGSYLVFGRDLDLQNGHVMGGAERMDAEEC
jgi:hypothetical protein